MSASLRAAADLDWSALVRPGDRVLWPQASGEPRTLVESFLEHHGDRDDIECFVGIPAGRTWASPAAGRLRWRSYTGSGVNRALIDEGRMALERVEYSRLPHELAEGALAADIVLLRASGPDRRGRFNLGPSADYHHAAIATARTVIVETGPALPSLPGAVTIPADRVDVLVRTDDMLMPMVWPEPDTRGQEVARHAARWVTDGATLQLGIGSLPAAVARHLLDRRGLGLHSGMAPDAVVPLLASGAMTGEHRPDDPGRLVAGALMGSSELISRAVGDDRLCVRPTGYTHDPRVLAAQPRLTALNAALQIDLGGRVNAEWAGDRYVGALGGARDFARGAAASAGGVSVTMLVAQSRHGLNVVADLGDRVTLDADDVGVVVTEFGSADLRGCDAAERERRIRRLAGPGVVK